VLGCTAHIHVLGDEKFEQNLEKRTAGSENLIDLRENFRIVFLLLPFVLGPLACFPSELILNYVSYIHLVRVLGRVVSPVLRPLPTQDNTNTKERWTEIHSSSWIRTQDPSVGAGKNISCLRSAATVTGRIAFQWMLE
jgi:hypothetical protein